MKGGSYRRWRCYCPACNLDAHAWGWTYDLPLPCADCGHDTDIIPETIQFGEAPGIAGDELPVGYEARHGVCWPDGTPRRFDTMSDLKRALNEADLKILGDTPGKPYPVRWSGVKKPRGCGEEIKPIVKTADETK